MADILKFAIPAVIILVIGAIVGYYVLRMLRGSINLTLPKTTFNPGEKVTGSFELKTKKPIEGNRLFAALVGERITERRDHDDHRRRNVDEIFRAEHVLEDARSYPAGHAQQYIFEIAAPEGGGPEVLNSGLGKALQMGAELLSSHRTRYRWRVEVRLDAKGIDLAASRRVTVNMPGIV
jgi:hypothetical protein